MSNLEQAKANLKQAGEYTKEAAKDKFHDMKNQAYEAKGEIEGKASDLNVKLQECCGKVKNYVSENPLTALGIAVAVGIGLSALINRK